MEKMLSKITRNSWLAYCLLLFAAVPGSSYADGIVSFTLINSATNADLKPLLSGETIDLSVTGSRLNVRANTNPATVGKVVFALDGVANYRSEGVAPYALAGDSNGDYNDWTPSVGTHTLTATPYSASGVAGTPLTITFTVTSGSPTGGGTPTTGDNGSGSVVVQGELKKWHKITLAIDGPASSETASTNPFLNYRLNVTFTNGTKRYMVPGYFAADANAGETGASAGNVWKVHFAPDEAGTWSYAVSMRTGSGIAVSDDPAAGSAVSPVDGKTGTFTVAATDKTGSDLRAKGRLRYTGAHHLQFAEKGEYFLKGGVDSPENFLAYEDFDNTPNNGGRRKTWSPHVQDWRTGDPTWKGGKGKGIIGAVNYLAGQGLNVFSFLTMNINGDDRNVYPYVTSTDYTRFDCSKLDQWEKVFEHADKMGLYLHFKTQEIENNNLLDGGNLGVQRKLYYRELIARFSHHLALNWNVGEENRQTDQQRKEMARYFYDHDPYRHNIVIHTWPGEQDLVYTPLLGSNSNYTGVSVQTSWNTVYPETRKWVQNSANAGKKWVVANDEQGNSDVGVAADAGYTGNRGTVADNQHDIRKDVLWGNLMAGGAGVEYYFGYATGETDLSAQDFRSRAKMWGYTRHALNFFRSYVPFAELSPLSTTDRGWLLGKEGQVYVVYLKSGGTANIGINTDATYSVRWYDPRNGGALQTGSVTSFSGTGAKSIGNPPHSAAEDWVALVKKEGPPVSSSCAAAYEEQNGVVVVEAENLSLPSGWQKKTAVGGYTGSGYIEWVNAENLSTPGVGLIETTIRITRTGKYYFRWHNKVGKGTSSTDHNDSWLRLPDASNFYGEGSRTVYPYGSGKTPNPNGAGADGWFKVYSSGTMNWSWSTNVSDNEPLQVVAEFNAPGVYKVQISARSDGHLIDRFALYHASVAASSALNLSNPETRCTSGTAANRPPVVTSPLADQVATAGQSFTYTFSTNAFSDPDGDPLTYTATLSDGTALPSWLSFNGATRTFSGVPPAITTLSITTTANDGKGGTVSDAYVLYVNPAGEAGALFRINAGGPAYTTPEGMAFSADGYFSGGNPYATGSTTAIGNTTSDALYQSERYGNVSYRLPVSNGTYTVILHFAEIYWGVSATGTRKFHVDVEGVRKLTDYNIVERAGGPLKAVQETIAVSVTDGTLNVDFYNGSADQAKISAIEVIAGGSTTAAARSGDLSNQTVAITAYPNPTTGTIVVEGVKTQGAGFNISVTNGVGTYFPRFKITSASSVQVMLNHVKAGLYIMRISQGGNDYFRKVLVER